MVDHASGFLQMAAQARQKIKEITVDTLQQWLTESKPFQLIDVREDREWLAGYIPQAVHCGKGVIERDIESLIPQKNTPVVLYCGGGYRSALAALSLKQMGYAEVYSLDSGIRGWVEQGLPLEKADIN